MAVHRLFGEEVFFVCQGLHPLLVCVLGCGLTPHEGDNHDKDRKHHYLFIMRTRLSS